MSVEDWVTRYQGGVSLLDASQGTRLAAALHDLGDVDVSFRDCKKDDIVNAFRLLGLPTRDIRCGKAQSVERSRIVTAVADRVDELLSTLQSDGDVDEDIADEKGEGAGQPEDGEGQMNVGEVDEVVEQALPPSDSPQSSPPPLSARPSPRTPVKQQPSRAARVRGEGSSRGGVADDELDDIMRLVRRNERDVSADELDDLTVEGRQMYNQLRADARSRPSRVDTVSQSVTFASPTSRSVVRDILRPPSMSPPSARDRPTPSRRAPHSAFAASTASSQSRPHDPDGVHGDGEASDEEPSYVTHGKRASNPLHRLLQRQGVPPATINEDMLAMAENEVGRVTFEQWWAAHASHIKKTMSSVYYEGLVLSLLLDNRDDVLVWAQLAARRWYTLRLVANGQQWNLARGLLPLDGMGGMPTSLLYELQKFEKSQSELRSRAPSFGGGGGDQRGGKRGSGKKKGGRSGNGSTAGTDDEKDNTASGGSRSRQRRGSGSGAGTPREGAAGAGRG